MFGAGPGFQFFGGCFISLEFGRRVLIFYIFIDPVYRCTRRASFFWTYRFGVLSPVAY